MLIHPATETFSSCDDLLTDIGNLLLDFDDGLIRINWVKHDFVTQNSLLDLGPETWI